MLAPSGRNGFTLAELVVALGVGGLALGVFALVVARQERAHAELTNRIRAHAQVREGITALAADLRSLSAAAGDIALGGARDSAIEFRSTVGTAVVCGHAGRTLALGLASFVAPPEAGDTLWALTERDSGAAWVPRAVATVSGADPSRAWGCPLPASASDVVSRSGSPGRRYSLDVTESAEVTPAPLPLGTPLRVTRWVRYSLYRAPDGGWYLGRREWSVTRERFASVQPVSGPYRAYAPTGTDASGLELEYFGPDGRPLATDGELPAHVTRISITLRSTTPSNSPPHRRVRGALSIGLRDNRP